MCWGGGDIRWTVFKVVRQRNKMKAEYTRDERRSGVNVMPPPFVQDDGLQLESERADRGDGRAKPTFFQSWNSLDPRYSRATKDLNQ